MAATSSTNRPPSANVMTTPITKMASHPPLPIRLPVSILRRFLLVFVLLQLAVLVNVFWIGPLRLIGFAMERIFHTNPKRRGHEALLFRFLMRPVIELARWWMDCSKTRYLHLTAALAQDLLGVRLELLVEGSDGAENASIDRVLLMNHMTRLDWFFLWILLAGRAVAASSATSTTTSSSSTTTSSSCATPTFTSTSDELFRLKVIAKGMRGLPFFGWACENFRFIHLKRNDAAGDLRRIRENILDEAPGTGITLLIFPEGTDLSENTVARSQKFQVELLEQSEGGPSSRSTENSTSSTEMKKSTAARETLEACGVAPSKKLLENVLLPRHAGLHEVLEAMGERNREKVVEVLDLTVSYEGCNRRPSEGSVFKNGDAPALVKFHMRKWSTSDVKRCIRNQDGDKAKSPEQAGANLKRLLLESFREKEVRLQGLPVLDAQRQGSTAREVIASQAKNAQAAEKPTTTNNSKPKVEIFNIMPRRTSYSFYVVFHAFVVLLLSLLPTEPVAALLAASFLSVAFNSRKLDFALRGALLALLYVSARARYYSN
ncbi:unnamed protein product [Amoebophrya sp. A25]|nr:unnamed protein product [Amoebophrya sp. A25]|eukprot:GSA25T00007431001.1